MGSAMQPRIMVFGGFCFAFAGLPLLVMSDKEIGSVAFMVAYCCIHGAARVIRAHSSLSHHHHHS